MKHILLALFLITSTAHGALTKVPATMANAGIARTQGISTTNIDVFGACFGGSSCGNNCTTGTCHTTQVGTIITSITRNSAGAYGLNFSKTYTKLVCTNNAVASGTDVTVPYPISCTACSGTTFNTVNRANGVSIDSLGSLVCIGEY